MADLNNDGVNDTGPTVERTTIVETGGGGGGGVIAVVLLVLVLLVLAYIFRDNLGFGGHKTEIKVPDSINVNVN
ncbi:hypothetical protein M8312_12045 [Sphingomonas sp. KRR8]|jgi:uncharacterized membrane protein|uniref:hypothetical protein n=1 Tax=Sphingomonas sp. KRR8 TaxID=2942996 RepID=UPI0020210059|nr:hypothetical protein [Sphingomonas sp. KRR8]URD60505.1 hypothetical protein M8312_12045 [Sphingomonas sp. KRR8]